MREAQLQRQILLALGALPGVRVWRNNVGEAVFKGRRVRYGLAIGSADLIACVDGRFCAIEVKGPSGHVRPEQERWLAAVRRIGGVAVVARSVDDALEAVRACKQQAQGARGGA